MPLKPMPLSGVFLAVAAYGLGALGDPGRPGTEPATVSNARALVPPHEEPPDLPWMPRPAHPPEGVIARCAPVARGRYASVQVNVDARGCNIIGDAANEPSIAIDPTDPRRMVIGWRQFDSVESSFRQAGYGYSHDAGHTWTFPGSLTPGVFGSDPVLDANGEGVFCYLSINFEEMRLFTSFDAGVTWTPPTQVVPFFADKPWMTIDRTDGIGRGHIYCKWTTSGGDNFARSTDGGAYFEPTYVPGPRWGNVSVGPDGALYIAGAGIGIARSTNAHDPNQVPAIDLQVIVDLGGRMPGGGPPNPDGLLGQAWVGTDHSRGPTAGNVYLVASVFRSLDDLTDVMFARSTDGGVTWSEKVRVNDDPEGNGAWQWFGMMSVAPNGRIDAVWNDTRKYLDAPDANLCELYYSYSSDAGETWSTNIPVSPMFDSHVGWPGSDDKLGDYYHMVSDNLGVNVAYAATFNGEQDIYFLRIGPHDCNANGIPDEDDIACATSYDCNENDVPDECEYRGDFDGDRLTTLRDFAAFQKCFTGDTAAIPTPCCRLFDLDSDDDIDLHDLKALHRVLSGP